MVHRIEPGPGQESVWDYPRPPRVEPTAARVRVVHRGVVVGDTTSAVRVLETSQAPAYYLPPADVRTELLGASAGSSWCEWKGRAVYWDLSVDGDRTPAVAWSYPEPTSGFVAITGYFSFYAQLVDECWVGDERVVPNDGSFYGGWITSNVVGPFKGGPGTLGW